MAATNRRQGRAGEPESGIPALLQGGTITALKEQVRRPGRRSLFIDGTFVIGLSEAVLSDLGWRVGQAVSAADLARAQAAEQSGAARDAALRYLASAPRSRQEVLRRLQRRGFSEEVAEAALRWLDGRGLLDDTALVHRLAESLRDGPRPLGRAAARRRLLARGFHHADVEAAVAAAYADAGELTAARAVATRAARRLQGLEHTVARRRLAGALQRRGFGYETILRMLRETLDDDGGSP